MEITHNRRTTIVSPARRIEMYWRVLGVCVRYVAACGVLSMRNVACHPRPVVTWSPARSARLLSASSPFLAPSSSLPFLPSSSRRLSLFRALLSSFNLRSFLLLLSLSFSFSSSPLPYIAVDCYTFLSDWCAYMEEKIIPPDWEITFLLCIPLINRPYLSFSYSSCISLFISPSASNETAQ